MGGGMPRAQLGGFTKVAWLQGESVDSRKERCEPLRTDSASVPFHIVEMMKKKRDRIELERKIISDVKREMQKPRLTESVRRSREEEVTHSKRV
jgi:hypothetical protein